MDKDQARSSRDALIDALTEAGASNIGNRNNIRCPFHDDKNASGSIHCKDNVWRYTCHGCGVSGDVFDIRAQIHGTTVADQLPKSTGGHVTANPEPRQRFTLEQVRDMGQAWFYVRDHAPAFAVVRQQRGGTKTYRQLRAVAENGKTVFEFGGPPKPMVLYNLPVQGTRVIVTEGEKAADAVMKWGWYATTSAGGAGNAHHSDWQPLAGKTVYLWPDNDPPGIQHMNEVADLLRQLDPAPTVRILDPTSLPPKSDAADTDQQTARTLLNAASDGTPAALVIKRMVDIQSGDWTAVTTGWRILDRMTRALLPGTITLLCGDPGSTKSLFLLQCAAAWLEQDIPFALYELEEDTTFHLHRALAQRLAKSQIMQSVEPADIEQARNHRVQDWLNRLAKHIYDTPRTTPTLDLLADWTRDRAKAGNRIIAIDPVSLAQPESKPWIADQKFVTQVKLILRDYGVSAILVTHPRKGREYEVSLDDLAGGAAYGRFSQTALWLERVPGATGEFKVLGGEDRILDYNRIVHVLKARNAPGQHTALGFQFDKDTLRFSECGTLVKRNAEPVQPTEGTDT